MIIDKKVYKMDKDALLVFSKEGITLDLKELKAFEVDGAKEKHIPVIKKEGNRVDVSVGEVLHPMQDVHYIEWILLETNKGFNLRPLKPNDMPCASFLLTEDEIIVNVYAYCNLHGLWKA